MSIGRYAKIGAFFISLVVSGSAFVIKASDGFNALNTKKYEVVLDDASGLSTNSKVYLAGVPVGKIKSIDLSGSDAVLTVLFLRNVEIREGTTITRKPSSILGTSTLNLTPGAESAPIMNVGERIVSAPGKGDMNQIVGSANDLTLQAAGLLREFQENQMQLLAVSLQTFNSLAQKIDDRSEAEMERITRILESTARVTENLDRLLAERQGDLGASATELKASLENLRDITDEIKQGNGNIGKAIYDEQLYDTLVSTVQSADEIVQKVNGLAVQLDSDGKYDLLAGNFRGSASLRLEPQSKDRWYRIGVSSNPNGLAQRTVTETSSGGSTSREETIETTFNASVDAELARRVGAFTLRGGILENTAGFGLDFEPVKWLNLSGDIYDFRKGLAPNLRGTVTLYPFFDPESVKPWNWLYLRGGITAALDSRRDFFVGAGVRFTDDEIRGIVGLVPAIK